MWWVLHRIGAWWPRCFVCTQRIRARKSILFTSRAAGGCIWEMVVPVERWHMQVSFLSFIEFGLNAIVSLLRKWWNSVWQNVFARRSNRKPFQTDINILNTRIEIVNILFLVVVWFEFTTGPTPDHECSIKNNNGKWHGHKMARTPTRVDWITCFPKRLNINYHSHSPGRMPVHEPLVATCHFISPEWPNNVVRTTVDYLCVCSAIPPVLKYRVRYVYLHHTAYACS